MRRTRSRALPVLAVTAALALAGCSFQGGVDEDAAAPTPGTSVTTAPATPSTGATPTTGPTDDAAPPTTSSPDASPSAPSGSDGAGFGGSGADGPPSTGSPATGSQATGSGSDSGGSGGSSGGAAPAPTATSGDGDAGAGTGTGGGATSGDGSASGGSGDDSGGGASSTGLQEIRFPAGQTTTTVRGQAPASQGPQYVFAASAGQQASLSISSDGDEVGFDLVAPDGTPLKTTMSSATSGSWTLPADGDYVVGLASPDAGVPYALTLTIK